MPDGTVIEVGADSLLTDDDQPLVLPTGPVFTADDMARARGEEKDKLYGRIDSLTETINTLKEQVGGLTAEEQRRVAAAAEERQRLEAEARAAEEQDLDAKSLIQRKEQEWRQQLDQTTQTWEQKFAEEQARREAAEALQQREREYNDLKDYTQAQVQANAEKIAPELLPWITGNSKEEIDAAVARAVETTDQITAQFQQAMQVQPPQDPNMVQSQVPGQPVVPAPPALPGTRVTGGPVNQDPGAQFQQLSAEDIKNMPMDKYAQLRGQMGIGGQSQNRGLYG
jgi:DNA repair exonuclease SbcCD ATPase subunit